MEPLSLEEAYKRCYIDFSSLIEEQAVPVTDELLSVAIANSVVASERVRELALFSKGEIIDEHPTSSLQYLFINYFSAKFHSSWLSIQERLSHLLISKRLFDNFIQECMDLNAIDPADSDDLRHEV